MNKHIKQQDVLPFNENFIFTEMNLYSYRQKYTSGFELRKYCHEIFYPHDNVSRKYDPRFVLYYIGE